MPSVRANEQDIYYESFGSESDPTILLIAGLGAHSISWDDEICSGLAARGHRVVRFDNRDVGLSSHMAEGDAYDLSDLAADTLGLLDALGLERVDVVGRSMGGMVAQTLAIAHPERVRTLTSIMSNTGEPEYGQPDPDLLAALVGMATPAVDRADAVERGVELARLLGSPTLFDEGYARKLQEACVDRNPDPAAVGRQMLAVVASRPSTSRPWSSTVTPTGWSRRPVACAPPSSCPARGSSRSPRWLTTCRRSCGRPTSISSATSSTNPEPRSDQWAH